MAKSRLVLAVLLSYGTFAPFLHAFVVSTYHHQGKVSFGIVIPQNSQRWHFSKGAPSRCCCHHGRPQLLSLQKDNDNDEEEREEVLFDDFDFTIGEAAASPEQSSSTPPRQLQERIRQVQQELIRKDSQLTKNWSLGNWRVRGFSLDKWNAKDREDEILRNEHSSSLVHVCRLVQAGPDCVIVGRTDGSVLLVLLGDEYLTKFTSKLTAKQQQDDTIQIQSELVRSEQESMNDNQEVLVAEPFQVLRQFQAHEQELSAMAEVEHFEGDQRLLFTAAKGSGEIRVWGLPEDDDDKVVPLRSLVEVHSDTVVSLKVLSLQPEEDPNLLFSASLDGTIALWEMATGDLVYKCQLMIKGERQSILCADVDSEKAMLYLGTASGQVVCFLVEAMVQCASTGEEQCPIPNGRFQAHDAAVTAIQHAGDGTLARSRPGTLSSILLTGGEDGVVKQWEIMARKAGEKSSQASSSEPTVILEHWPRLATQRMQKRAHLFEGHVEGTITALASIDPSKFLSAGADGTIRVWNPTKGNEMFRMDGFTDTISSLCLNTDMLITDGMAEYVCVHDFDVDASEVEDGYELEW